MPKVLPHITLQKSKDYLKHNCRPLEQALFSFFFESGEPSQVIQELSTFQNDDGGFGKALEPDFLLPSSSPLATTVAFQTIDKISVDSGQMVQQAVRYLEQTYDSERKGWLAVRPEVNNFPHAVWWHYNEETHQTPIDESWGNPSAEIIGYLNKYQTFISTLDLEALTNYCISYWESKKDYPSEHEVYCFIRLHKNLPSERAKLLEPNIIAATRQLVVHTPEEWKNYSPQPLHFCDDPDFFLYDLLEDDIEQNLDYLVNTISTDGVWLPNWNWGQYQSEWDKAKSKWIGVLTIQNLRILQTYNRLEM